MFLNRYLTLANLYTLANLFVLSIAIYCGVDIFYTLAGSRLTNIETEHITAEDPEEITSLKEKRPFDFYLSAIQRELFGAVKEPADTSKELELEDLEPATLNATLLGTVSGDSENAVAVIQERARRAQSLYKEGDTVQNATIVKILRGKVILRVGDKNQVLTMEETPKLSEPSRATRSRTSAVSGPPSRRSRTITLDRSTVASSLQNINKLLSQVRVRPHYRGGEPDGLMLSQVKPNTIFSRMGLRNGDVIQSVGGKSLTSPDDIMEFYEDLKSGSSVSLEIMRRGKKERLDYRFR